MLEGGILTFFKDSKHSSAGALVSAVGPREGQHRSGGGDEAVGWGREPWGGTRTHGRGSDPWDKCSTQ